MNIGSFYYPDYPNMAYSQDDYIESSDFDVQ